MLAERGTRDGTRVTYHRRDALCPGAREVANPATPGQNNAVVPTCWSFRAAIPPHEPRERGLMGVTFRGL